MNTFLLKNRTRIAKILNFGPFFSIEMFLTSQSSI